MTTELPPTDQALHERMAYSDSGVECGTARLIVEHARLRQNRAWRVMSTTITRYTSFEELLDCARNGERGAMDVLLKRHSEKLQRYARQLAASQPDGARPSDFVQNMAMRAVVSLETFRGSTEAEWVAWLRKILQTEVGMAARRAGRLKRGPGSPVRLDAPEALSVRDTGVTPSHAAAWLEDWHRVLSALHELPDGQKEAIKQCYLEELPVVEVARTMQRSETSVASLLQRGLRALRERLSGPTMTSMRSSDAQQSRALLDYLRRRDLGEYIDQESFLREYPDIAADLRSILTSIAAIQAVRPRSK